MKNNTKQSGNKKNVFEKMSARITKATGSPYAFISAFVIIIIWGVSGPLFDYSDTWQLVINTGTTIITFLMVFVIQQSQNKDTMAIQLKLNELIASTKGASNHLVDVEDLTEKELETIKKFYIKLATLAGTEDDVLSSHSIDEATEIHLEKMRTRKPKSPAGKK